MKAKEMYGRGNVERKEKGREGNEENTKGKQGMVRKVENGGERQGMESRE